MLDKEDLFGKHMLFYTFDDFMKKRFYIKSNLAFKDQNYFICYRMYIESRPWIKEYFRGCIWDFLNDYLTDDELKMEYQKYVEKYGGING